MYSIPFVKAHAARNDFLLSWSAELPPGLDLEQAARDLCDRHSGIGADGWYVLAPSAEADVAAKLFNADGSGSELSGNGSRCVAALLYDNGHAAETPVRILTGAGLKAIRMISAAGGGYRLEMAMGAAPIVFRETLQHPLGAHEAVILTVGNPQCAVPVDDFDLDWRTIGAALERHSRFPHRTNVSFVRRTSDRHRLEVRIWERGVGETQSSGTGCTGAAAAARYLGWVDSPVEVLTAAGPLDIRWEGDDYFLTGPAQVIASGEFRRYAEPSHRGTGQE